jgi:hypothetical protein
MGRETADEGGGGGEGEKAVDTNGRYIHIFEINERDVSRC